MDEAWEQLKEYFTKVEGLIVRLYNNQPIDAKQAISANAYMKCHE